MLFAVTDTGPGVPADRRKAIFEDFEQGDGSNARRFEGAGLGLAISSRLVALMGGSLGYEDNPGGGSVFVFTVSLPESEAAAAAGVADPAPAALEGRRALIIANSPFEAPAIAARLAEAGASVTRAEGLASGLARLSAKPAGPRRSSIARSAPRRPTGLLRRRARPARRRASSCSRRSSGEPSAKRHCRALTAGW